MSPTITSGVTQTGTRVRGALTTRGRAFLAAGLTLLAGGLLLGFTDITRVGILLSALPLLAGLNARRRNDLIAVTRKVDPARLVVDQAASVSVVLQNTSHRRTRLRLAEERVHPLMGERPRFVLPAMEPSDIREVSYQIRSHVRGRFRLGPLTLRRRDPYGLATITASLSGSSEILVLPRIEILGRGQPRASGVGGEGAIAHMVALHGQDDAAVRSYRQGDDLRHIHWPTTAHRSELMVRQEDHFASRRAVVVLDSREDAHQGSGTAGSFEWAVTAAASIASYLSEQQYTIHLASSETTARGVRPAAMQTLEVDDVMASLALAQLGASAQFDEVLSWAHPLTSTGGLVVAIVADHDEDALKRTAALRQPQGDGVLMLMDTVSFAGQGPGRPGETGGPDTANDHARAMSAMVAEAGWSTCVVGQGMTVADAWSRLVRPPQGHDRGRDLAGHEEQAMRNRP